MMDINALRRVLAPIKRRIRNSMVRGLLKLTTDGAKLQVLQVQPFANDTKDDVERFQDFGLKTHAPKGSEVVMLSLAGSSEHLVVISAENREVLKNLPALDEGDGVLYNLGGVIMHLKGDTIETTVQKMKFENDTTEFLTKLLEILKKLRDSKWNTAIGPQPIFATDKTELDSLIAELESFKI